MDEVADPRYRRRRELGEASRAKTRQRLLAVADELFREQGYVATTVVQIVRRAEVSVQTLYLTWGSKRALLRAAADAAATDTAEPPTPESWRSTVDARIRRGDGDLAQELEALAVAFTELAERSAPYWVIYRQAAAVDPEIADDWAATIAARRATLAGVAAALPRDQLIDGLDADTVLDTLFALASPDTYELLTRHAANTTEDFHRWLARTLVACLARAPREGGRAP